MDLKVSIWTVVNLSVSHRYDPLAILRNRLVGHVIIRLPVIKGWFKPIAIQLKLEIKVLGGNGQIFSIDAFYDTGCESMALLYSEAQPILIQGAAGNFQPVTVNTASSSTNACIQVHVRIMLHNRKKVVLDWEKTLCNPHQSIPARIFLGKLANHKFVCVASSKHEVYQKMPN